MKLLDPIQSIGSQSKVLLKFKDEQELRRKSGRKVVGGESTEGTIHMKAWKPSL